MDNNQQRNTILHLKAAGYDASPIILSENRNGVKIDTDYHGPYPGREQFNILDFVRKKYGKKYTVESRGYYSAIFIY